MSDQSTIEARTRRFQNGIHYLLTWGIIASSIFMVVGLLLELVNPGSSPPVVNTLDQLLPDLLAWQPSGFLTLGLLTLIATPILRVFGSLLVFLAERDWRYTLVTAIVLVIVFASILFG